jgi:hypothetical protein
MKSIKTIIGIVVAIVASGCFTHTEETPNGTLSRTNFLIFGSSKKTSKLEYGDCMKTMTSMVKDGQQTTPNSEADRYCRNAATFGAPPSMGSPDQFPPQICGQNVQCPEGVPNGVQKFNGMPMGGVPYNMVGGGYYGTTPYTSMYQPYGAYTPATGGYHAALFNRGALVGYPGDAATVGTSAHLVTRDRYDRDVSELKQADEDTAKEVINNTEDIKSVDVRTRKVESALASAKKPAKPTAKVEGGQVPPEEPAKPAAKEVETVK